jgi:protocatechuate 3,4-dioxygenase beta subunit
MGILHLVISIRMLSIITGLGRSGNLRVWSLAAGMAILAAACDKLPLLAPRESTIKLSTASTVVQANGTTEIRATVLEPSGTPVQNGTTVTFTTNLGTLSPTEARTFNGVAAVQFLGNGQSGKASIRAISGGAASDPLEVSVGAAATGRVVVTANPNQVAPGSPSTITATVTDTNGNPLSGVPVSFSTDNGSLSSTVANTSSTGQAQVVLVTNRDATVTASASAGTSTPATVKVTVASVPEITITSSSSPTEGQPVIFTIAVAATGSTETFQSLVVEFGDGTTSGTLSGSSQNVSHIYARPGTYTVEVTGTSATGNSRRATTTIVVADRPLVDVRITKDPSGNVQPNQVVTFTASATGGGTPRSYSWNFGDGRTFNGGSQVSHSYSTPGTKTVTVTVTTTDGNTGRGQTQVVVEP